MSSLRALVAFRRYKCPLCRAPFCCVQCSKDHKANHCTGNIAAASAASTSDGVAAARAHSNYLPRRELAAQPPRRRRRPPPTTSGDDGDSHDDEPGWNVTPEMRKRLRESTWLHEELRDGGLRQLIGRIDAASDVEEPEREEGRRRGDRKGRRGGEPGANISPRELELARTRRSHRKFASFVDRLMLTAGVLQAAGGRDGERDDVTKALEGGEVSGPLVLAPARARGTRDESEHSSSESDSTSSTEESSDSDGSESSDESESSDDSEESTSDDSSE